MRSFTLFVPLPLCYKRADMTNTLATYIHHLDPVIWDIPGTPLAIRWYGLAYVGGFVMGYLVLLWMSKRELYCVKSDKLGDFITAICIFGVLCGGRLGEFFFYWLPKEGLSGFLDDPLWVLRVWEGGMASHGGIIAVILVALWYAWKHKHSLLALCDGLAIVAPIGICFGRVANFINGELYGRVADAANPIAMKFPLEIHELPLPRWYEMYDAVLRVSPVPVPLHDPSNPAYSVQMRIIELCQQHEGVREAVGQFLTPRYPSQLFEAAAEGLIIFVVLFALRLGWKSAPAGIFSALFCFLYAAGRISTECFRQPDAPMWGDITRGQYLSFAVAAMGIAFLIPALRQLKKQKMQKSHKNS